MKNLLKRSLIVMLSLMFGLMILGCDDDSIDDSNDNLS
jgi:hypothetical protein